MTLVPKDFSSKSSLLLSTRPSAFGPFVPSQGDPLTAMLHPSRFCAIKYLWNNLITLLHEIFTGETSVVTQTTASLGVDIALWNSRDLSHALIPMNCSQ